MAAANLSRRAATDDTAFTHKLHDILHEELSDNESDDEIPETKNQYFEFSNSYYVMRFIKLILFIQVLGIMIDHPSLQIAVLFNIFCRGILFYSIRFYSRPFLDALYILQYFWHEITESIKSQKLPATPEVEIIGPARLLNENPYGDVAATDYADKFEWSINLLNPHHWHTTKHFGHYFLTILFSIMAVAFTFRLWEISDYSNRDEVKAWLDKYIADGWWRKGGLHIAKVMAQGLAFMTLFFLVLNGIARNFSAYTITSGLILSAILSVIFAVIGFIWLIGFLGIRTTEAAFVRYVSQNVAYTSAIILKRAVKAKFDLGLILMCSMYMPLLYTLLQSLLYYTDWNDTLAPEFRKRINFYVPCYFIGFPPYHEYRDAQSCPVIDYVSTSQKAPDGGYYLDSSILQCDSYFGIALYVVSASCLVYAILGYYYMFLSMISLVVAEFKYSKWVDVLEKLIRIKDEEERDYDARFPWYSRLFVRITQEFQLQVKHYRLAFFWFFETTYYVILQLFLFLYRVIRAITRPFEFFIGRLVILIFLNIQAMIFREDPRTTSRKHRELSEKLNSRSAKRGTKSKPLSKEEILKSQRAMSSKDVLLDDDVANPDIAISEKEEGFKLSSTSLGGDKKINLDESKKTSSQEDSSPSAGIGIDNEYTSSPQSDELKDEYGTWTKRLQLKIMNFLYKINIFRILYKYFKKLLYKINKRFLKLKIVAFLRVKLGLFINDTFYEKREDGALARGIASLGAHPAPWRKQLTLKNKTRLVNRLKHHVVAELRLAKLYFISDHELVIGFMDYTIDSSGLFTLSVLYNYNRMYWFMVVLFEITLYPVVGAVSKQFILWPSRNYAMLAINVLFGVITYIFGPYTEDIDRWFEFTGRILVTLVAGGIVEYADRNQDVIDATATPLFRPWDAIQYVYSIMENGTLFTFPVILDICMTVYFFCYFLYILYSIGVFGVFQRMWKAVQFSYHDHILDFLVEKSEEKTFGVENTFTGLTLLEQWDDIIKSQRRYALIPWPDVRPDFLISIPAKLIEVKWAAFFNLTLKNIRSSLGLTILHATMFSADGEVCRWIMYANPELLQVMDSQNDTPITIALKECAYFLLCYGDQNGGRLDDGTSYDDDDYANYYPEVDDVRDEIYNHGEFISEISIEYYLTSEDLIAIQKEGKYVEPQKPNYGSVYDDQGMPIKLDFPPNAVLPNQVTSKGQAVISWQQREEKRVLDQAKKKERTLQAKQKRERQSLIQKRFPEDSLFRSYESGQSTSWNVIGYEIPNENVFLDSHICKRIQRYPHFHYSSTLAHQEDFRKANPVENEEKKFDGNQQTSEGTLTTIVEGAQEVGNTDESVHDDYFDMTSHKMSSKVDFDLQYIVPTTKKVHLLSEESMIVPMDHPHLKEYLDFDRSRNRRKSSFASNVSSRSDGGEKDRRKSIVSNHSNYSDSTIFNIMKRRTIESDRDVRFKVCKFAEILLSKEIAESCKNLKWGIADFKAFNKLASMNQGKIAQQLALVCHLNPPDGFVRISDWSRTYNTDAFDERPEEDLPMLVKGIVAVVQKVEQVISTANDAFSSMADLQRRLRPGSSRPSSKARGRSKRQRSTKSLAQIQQEKQQGQHDDTGESGILCDRIVQYLAEALVCSTPYLVLDDCELSYNARRGWRAIARALRQKYCSFIVPSIFVPPYPINLISLELPRNELDCGDCIYVADILFNQSSLRYLDLSFNRIGGRGLSRVCKALREHSEILVCKFNNNIVGPGAGQDIGILLKQTKCLRILDLHDNHLGEIIRYPTLYSREKIPSAAKYICLGLRQNKSLEILDLSYNHLGETLGLYLPLAANKHPYLHTINISGNDLGPVHGCNVLFSLAGAPLGAQYAKDKENFIRVIKNRQTEALKEKQQLMNGEPVEEKPAEEILNQKAAISGGEEKLNALSEHSLFANNDGDRREDDSIDSFQSKVIPRGGVQKGKQSGMIETLGKSFQDQLSKLTQPAVNLTSLSIADNQLGPFSGHAVAMLLEKIKGLTHLDISGNSLGPQGGELITDQIELLYGIYPREFLKIVLFEIEEKKYTGRNAKVRKKLFTNLCSLNMARNNIGPRVISGLAYILKNPNCGIFQLDISLNPVGLSSAAIAGNAAEGAVDLRKAMIESKSLVEFHMRKTAYLPTELVTIFGGMAHQEVISKLTLSDTPLDEPACLQLGNILEHSNSLTYLDVSNCKMGANGGLIVAQKINKRSNQLRYLNVSNNSMGPIAAVYLAEGMQNENCTYHTVNFSGNDFLEEGGVYIAKALINNISATYVDLSNNQLSSHVGELLSDAVRGQFKNGIKVRDSPIQVLILNDNPMIGYKSARLLVKGLSTHHVQHIELRNIGAGSRTAEMVSSAFRDPSVGWRYVDISENNISRVGMNQIFWAIRNNRRCRVLNVSLNPVGSVFCSNEDALLTHGISVPVMIKENVVLRELNLSFLALTSEAGINIFDAIIDNHTIKKLSLRGNLLDDNVALMLPDLLKCNNVLEEIDFGHNRMGFACAYAIAESLEVNRSLKRLFLEYNNFGGAGNATLDSFARSLMMNYSLQVLFMDGNKLGPEWGIRLGEAIVRNNTLVQFSLRDNRLDSRAGESLLNAFTNAPYLLELAVTADEIGYQLYDQFRRIFNLKRASVHPDMLLAETVISPKQSALLSTYQGGSVH